MTNFEEPVRFWSKVDVDEVDECWEWLAGKMNTGYGAFGIRHGLVWLAHRVAWTLTFGPIPEGLCVLHHCDNRGCVNPYHLFLGTRVDNINDAMYKGRRARKLTVEDVGEIRRLLAIGVPKSEIAHRFDVAKCTIGDILEGRTWDWLEED